MKSYQRVQWKKEALQNTYINTDPSNICQCLPYSLKLKCKINFVEILTFYHFKLKFTVKFYLRVSSFILTPLRCGHIKCLPFTFLFFQHKLGKDVSPFHMKISFILTTHV